MPRQAGSRSSCQTLGIRAMDQQASGSQKTFAIEVTAGIVNIHVTGVHVTGFDNVLPLPAAHVKR